VEENLTLTYGSDEVQIPLEREKTRLLGNVSLLFTFAVLLLRRNGCGLIR
jgi:hypothetical protein